MDLISIGTDSRSIGSYNIALLYKYCARQASGIYWLLFFNDISVTQAFHFRRFGRQTDAARRPRINCRRASRADPNLPSTSMIMHHAHRARAYTWLVRPRRISPQVSAQWVCRSDCSVRIANMHSQRRRHLTASSLFAARTSIV